MINILEMLLLKYEGIVNIDKLYDGHIQRIGASLLYESPYYKPLYIPFDIDTIK